MSIDQSAWNARKASIAMPDGRPLAFIDTGGSGPVLLLLHGYSDTSRSFSLMAPELDGLRLLIPDLAGHGASAAGNRMEVDAFCDDIDHLLDVLDIRQLAIAGHSMGAMIGLVLAARLRHRVKALAMISGALRPEFPADSAISRGILALADPISPADLFFDDWHASARPVDPAFLASARCEAAEMPAYVWHAILKGFDATDLSAAARQVKAPVLCIAGVYDPLFGASHRAALTVAFPDAQRVVLEDHGHNPHWEDPSGVAAVLQGFLKETRPAPMAASSRI